MLFRSFVFLLIALFSAGTAVAATCDIKDADSFIQGDGTSERINLITLSSGAQNRDVVTFRARLRVNTDGAPTSYSPTDLTGRDKAINNICNGVSVRDSATGRALRCADARTVFAQFRDNGWRAPPGHTIRWQNVIAARTVEGRQIPCVFETGPNAGFFGSLTTLRNGLSASDAGECLVNDQIDHRLIPALVLPGGDNALRRNGARIGDLVIAHNPSTGITRAAIIADSGPADNLGEGSVALNMALLNRTVQPTTYRDALQLDTGSQQMLVSIIPGSALFNRVRPYTAANIDNRVSQWLASLDLATPATFIEALAACAPR